MSLTFRSLCQKIYRNLNQFRNNIVSFSSKNESNSGYSESPDYVVQLALQQDHYNILKLMQETYYPDEPTCACLGINSNPLLEERTRKFLREGLSLVARCKHDNCIVGACINCSIQRWDPDLTEKLACSAANPNVRSLLLFYAHVSRLGDLWGCYDTSKIFEMAYIFVKHEHRRRGVCTKLVQESIKLGRDCGYPIVKYDATNYRTALVCKNVGMQLFDAIPFCAYLGRNYEPIFRPPHPNDSVKIYIKAFKKPVDSNETDLQ